MRELVLLSGKGGTGKTAISASLAHQASHALDRKTLVLVDADVDAANLDMVVGSEDRVRTGFIGGKVAEIDEEACISCGICEDVCRFDAIERLEGWAYGVQPLACEGCAACFHQCPMEAIRMKPRRSGWWYQSSSRYGPLFHARLEPGQENSGKLVSLVKERAREKAATKRAPLMITDGPPGIACPAIAALSGADLVLIVAEPTLAGLHDLERAQAMASHFRAPSLACINKADLHPEGARAIEARCREEGIETVGSIPFDENVARSLSAGRPITEYDPASPASQALGALWSHLRDFLLS